MLRFTPLLSIILLILAACGSPPAPVSSGVGVSPELPEPENKIIPTVNVAEAQGWQEGQLPSVADGFKVSEFASGLDHPRWVYVLPNGDVLVAESNSPKTVGGIKGIKGFVARKVLEKAGASVPSADRITVFRDKDKNGLAETRSVFLENLYSPLGMTLIDNKLYIANTDGIVTVNYQNGDLQAGSEPLEFFPLPGGELNHHWTKNILATPDGSKIYAAVGSNSNIGENGMHEEIGRAAIWEIDTLSAKGRVFATGLRNPVGLDFGPDGKTLFTVVNERDELGDNLVPDYLTSVQDGAFYGWPYSYFGKHIDQRVKPQRPDLVATAIAPDYAVGAHTAPLGLVISDGSTPGIQKQFGVGAFIGQHGSWNRKPRSGYQVIFVPFVNGEPQGDPVTVLSGFLSGDIARGRPVGVDFDTRGGLLVADDVGNKVWRVAPESEESF